MVNHFETSFYIPAKHEDKYWVEKMPGFHIEKYPFIVCAGKNEIWILNINSKAKTIKNLIMASSYPKLAQPGLSFIPYYPQPGEEAKEEMKEETKEETKEEAKEEGDISRCIFLV